MAGTPRPPTKGRRPAAAIAAPLPLPPPARCASARAAPPCAPAGVRVTRCAICSGHPRARPLQRHCRITTTTAAKAPSRAAGQQRPASATATVLAAAAASEVAIAWWGTEMAPMAAQGHLQLGIGHQLLLPELCKVDHRRQVAPQPHALRLVHVLRRRGAGAAPLMSEARAGLPTTAAAPRPRPPSIPHPSRYWTLTPGPQLPGRTFMPKSLTPHTAMRRASCRKKLRAAMDSSCSSGYSNASMAEKTGWLSSSLGVQRGARRVLAAAARARRARSAAPAPLRPRGAAEPGHARQVDEDVLKYGRNHLVGGLGHLCRIDGDFHLLQAGQQLLVPQHGEAELRHGCCCF